MRLHNFISFDTSRKLLMVSSAVEWPIKDEDIYWEHILLIELSQNLITMSICPILEISLKASSKHITHFEVISIRSSSWKNGASSWVVNYANFFTILLSGSIILGKSTNFEMSCLKNDFQWTLQPIIFQPSEHHFCEYSELPSETPLEFYLFQLL